MGEATTTATTTATITREELAARIAAQLSDQDLVREARKLELEETGLEVARRAYEQWQGIEPDDERWDVRRAELGSMKKDEVIELLLELERKTAAPKAKKRGKGVKEVVLALFSDERLACLTSSQIAALVNRTIPDVSTSAGSVSCYPTKDADVIAAMVPRQKL